MYNIQSFLLNRPTAGLGTWLMALGPSDH